MLVFSWLNNQNKILSSNFINFEVAVRECPIKIEAIDIQRF